MKSITDDILEWSEKYIEPKNKHLGVSVCPYAKRARLENKYKMIEEFKKSKVAQDIQKAFPDARLIDFTEKE